MERYIDSPYCQHFFGEIYFQYKYPFDPSGFVHFRKHIGEKDTAYNMRKWMRLKRQEILNLIFRWIYQALILSPGNIQR